jgi:hypothetical protein
MTMAQRSSRFLSKDEDVVGSACQPLRSIVHRCSYDQQKKLKCSLAGVSKDKWIDAFHGVLTES